MKPEEVNLSSVNWEFGMLLTPEHFLRQERYFEAGLLWALRYATSGFGLVGGGPRLPEAERGAVKHDPVVVIDQDENSLHIAVTQCRALTPGGCIIEIDPEHPIERRFANSELEGVAEAGVYISGLPFAKQVSDGAPDDFNPQIKSERRPAYHLSLASDAATAPYSICLARLRRQRYGAGFEKDAAFIPPCAAMSSLSELTAAWRRLVDAITLLADRYTELYRAMREFLVLFAERGVDTENDREAVQFVERMVAVLQDCAYELLDPVQTPQRFFARLRRTFYSAVVYLDLTPSVQQYFETLKETGETEFIALLDQQRHLLNATRTWRIHEDLAVEVRAALSSISALQRLERALEGKYLDFHISPSLEAMNFLFDRGGKVLYKIAAKPARVQGMADELSIYFSQLRLEGRDKYRLILVGEQNSVFEKGTRIAVEIRINDAGGFRRSPVILSCESNSQDQRNFEYDFEAPDVPTITDIRVSLQAHLPIRTALLFTRHRFYAQRVQEGARPVEPLQPADSRAARAPERAWNTSAGVDSRRGDADEGGYEGTRRPEYWDPSRPAPPAAAPREAPGRPDDPRKPQDPPAPPRRRRLE